MSNLTSHERYEIYKHSLGLGMDDSLAVKIRENATNTLSQILSYRSTETDAGELIIGAFDWYHSPEGEDYWGALFTQFEEEGVTE